VRDARREHDPEVAAPHDVGCVARLERGHVGTTSSGAAPLHFAPV
jgi:hypothetical protein